MVHFVGTPETARRGDREGADVAGAVVKVARDGKSITVVTTAPGRNRDEEPKKVEVPLGDRTAIVYHNVPPGGAKVAEGLIARVWLQKDSKDAARVIFTGVARERWSMVAGRVVGVGKDGKSITLAQRPRGRDEQGERLEIKITARTRIGYAGVGPGEARLTEGHLAQVRLAEGSKDTAAGILFVKPGSEARR
jgi:hypothetical protein